jgi:hypothetical protein
MTNPNTDHKSGKPTATPHPARHAAAAPERQTKASTTMIEACDRLAQKLDEVASLFREQIEAGRETGPAAAPHSSGRETAANLAVDAQGTEHVPWAGEAQGNMPPGLRAETRHGQQEYSTARAQEQTGGASAGAPPAGARGEDGRAAADARRLVDTISRSQNGWQEQAAGARQALEAIMAHLESQAASAAPKVDVADIMSRLRDLEEQQQSLQSEFSNNRWGPS